ncbi:MAG: HD domain-containing protein [Ginsengibacter sp.]
MDEDIIAVTAEFVKKELAGAEGGHDWWHIQRVWNNARMIAAGENANLLIVNLAALLHDVADAKFHQGDETVGPERAVLFLESRNLHRDDIEHIKKIIENISFKGGNAKTFFTSIELNIVQDADRLDAMGAIGIARAFNYGGFTNREIYNPAILPDLQMSKQAYKKSTAPTLNHFYEKLLLLKDRMNTVTGKKFAEERHEFMQIFLDQFYKEWNAGT